jgi:hypothetical protein
MEAVVERKSQELHQNAPAMKELHAIALQATCAYKVEFVLSEIFASSEDDRVKAKAILDIATRRSDYPSIQLLALQDLKILDPSSARLLVSQLLQEPLDEERDHIRARALATLVELPDITPNEAMFIGEGLKCRIRNVAHAVKQAINSLSRPQLGALEDAIAKLRGVDASKVAPLVAVVKEAYPSAPNRSVSEDFEEERDQARLSSHKGVRSAASSGAAGHRLSGSIRPPAPLKSVAPSGSRPAPNKPETSRVSSSPAAPARSFNEPTMQAQSVEPINLPPRPVVSTTAASLEALRDSKLLDKTWQELLFERDRQKDPRKLCACIAEMVARFGVELTRDAASTSLIYVVSHPDPELKRMGGVLVDHLFRRA